MDGMTPIQLKRLEALETARGDDGSPLAISLLFVAVGLVMWMVFDGLDSLSDRIATVEAACGTGDGGTEI